MLPTAVANLFANAWSPRSTATSAADLGSSDLEYDIPSRRPLIDRIPAQTACECIPRRNDCFKEGVACQQPRSHVGKEPTAMAYKAGEGTPQ